VIPREHTSCLRRMLVVKVSDMQIKVQIMAQFGSMTEPGCNFHSLQAVEMAWSYGLHAGSKVRTVWWGGGGAVGPESGFARCPPHFHALNWQPATEASIYKQPTFLRAVTIHVLQQSLQQKGV
jgi:hypothetical protein